MKTGTWLGSNIFSLVWDPLAVTETTQHISNDRRNVCVRHIMTVDNGLAEGQPCLATFCDRR